VAARPAPKTGRTIVMEFEVLAPRPSWTKPWIFSSTRSSSRRTR
jgi:hypothetical protein